MTPAAESPEGAASSGSAGPESLGPRITAELLDRLAMRVTVAGRRDRVPITMPATGKILGHVPHGTADDVAAAAEAARGAQPRWAQMDIADRSKVLLRFAELLLSRQDEVLDLIQLENGKARRHAFEEIIDVAQTSRYYARPAPRYLRSQRRAGALPGLTRTREYHHAKGVVGVISPWNYPLTLGISDALPALAAGNGVIAKPDGQTPYSALWAAELLAEAGLPPGVLQVVTGPGPEPDMGSLISAKQLDTVARHVSDAIDKGAEPLAGGTAPPDMGIISTSPPCSQGPPRR